MIACTLSGDDYQKRLAAIAKLAGHALRRFERDDLRLTLHYDITAAARVRAMVTEEQACCGFLTFELDEEDANEVRVSIRAPDEARLVADEIFAVFIGPHPASERPGQAPPAASL